MNSVSGFTFTRRIRARATVTALGILVTQAVSCVPTAVTPVIVTLDEVHTDIGRGGRSVAVSASAVSKQIAIVGTESGGLFRTTDGGGSWQHIDAFAPFRIEDVAFAEPGASNTSVVIVTASNDAQTNAVANSGGIWRSTDAGVTWAHVSAPGCFLPQSAFGIAFTGPNRVFVGSSCGLLSSTDLGATWTTLDGIQTKSVIARELGGSLVLDVCTPNLRSRHSTDGGVSWNAGFTGLACDTPHAIAGSPIEANVVFAVYPGGMLVESDDGGLTWPIDLGATSNNNRPQWVRTRKAMDGDPSHFDLYYPGRVVTCNSTPGAQRCATNVAENWPRLPSSPVLNHDINGIAFVPGNACPWLMAADYGVYRAVPTALGAPCGPASGWTHVGKASNGLHSLQIYEVAGQLQFPVTGQGISVSGSTHLFLGTMDNLVWANYDAGPAGWQGFGAEGSFLQVLYENTLLPASDLQLTYVELGRLPAPQVDKIIPNPGGASWSQPPAHWSIVLPGPAMPPILIGPHTYVQWMNLGPPLLFLTTDGGANFTAIANLPPNPTNPVPLLGITKYGSTQVTMTPAGPALYEVVTDGTNSGLALLTNLSATPTPRAFEVRTFAGRNGQGFASGLTGIMSHCFGMALYCQAVYAVDRNDYRNLIAVDSAGAIVRTSDAGRTWQSMPDLTNLVTVGGAISFKDPSGGSQARVIAYDPRNSQHILVGTDQAGIIASANGGLTWSALPGTAQATAITSFFFDDRMMVIYVGTYGRGLWKLAVDWTTVGH
jgi:photosystem II stability/assembly factor-like uncharacterized protein